MPNVQRSSDGRHGSYAGHPGRLVERLVKSGGQFSIGRISDLADTGVDGLSHWRPWIRGGAVIDVTESFD
jgi:hypothetical protein